MRMPERRETAGESRPTRKTKYMPSPAKGMRSVISRSSVMTEASTMRSVLFKRPGVGWRSCQRRSSPGGQNRSHGTLPHDRDGGLADAEELRVGVVDADANREPRREVYPVERALDVGQAVGELAVLGEDSEANALDVAVEAAVGMTHEIDLDVRADGDVLRAWTRDSWR